MTVLRVTSPKTAVQRLAVAAGMAVLMALSGCGSTPDKQDETRGWTSDKLYAEAREAMDSGDFAKAAKYFESLEAKYPFGPLAQQAQINTAYAHYRDGEIASALAAADRFIQLHPNHPNVDYAWYLKGLINFNDNLGWFGRLSGQDLSERDPKAAKASFEAFRTLTMRYPNSKYAADATTRMKYIVNSLALGEVHAARHYYMRGAYVAAANRAQQAVRDYEGAPAVEEALYIMMRSYEALGLKDLSADAQRVLAKNYPDSQYLKGQRVGGKPWWKLW